MYYTRGLINHDFFNDYLKKKLPKKSLDIIYNEWKNIDEESIQIETLTFYFKGMGLCYYTELILLDINDCYIPVLIENINTSSPYCLSKSYFELEDDNDNNGDDDDDNNESHKMELNEICEKLHLIYNKQKFAELIGSLE
jgi:hypothetical protein